MKDQSKTKQVLIQELSLLRQKFAELEQSESDRKNMEEAMQVRSQIIDAAIDSVFIHDLESYVGCRELSYSRL